MSVGLSIFFGLFLFSIIGLVGGLMILSMIAEKHTRLNDEIIEYCNSFKREFKMEERNLLEKNIKRKFPQVEFSDFEYTIHEKIKTGKKTRRKKK